MQDGQRVGRARAPLVAVEALEQMVLLGSEAVAVVLMKAAQGRVVVLEEDALAPLEENAEPPAEGAVGLARDGSGIAAVEHEALVDIKQAAKGQGGERREMVVHDDVGRPVEADGPQGGVEDDGATLHASVHKECVAQRAGMAERGVAVDGARRGVVDVGVAIGSQGAAVVGPADGVVEAFELVFEPDVVLVAEDGVGGLGKTEQVQEVPGRRTQADAVLDEDNAPVGRRKGAGHVGRFVGGPVVVNVKRPVGAGLVLQRTDLGGQEFRAVESGE